jgi:hypothetical protein
VGFSKGILLEAAAIWGRAGDDPDKTLFLRNDYCIFLTILGGDGLFGNDLRRGIIFGVQQPNCRILRWFGPRRGRMRWDHSARLNPEAQVGGVGPHDCWAAIT